MTTPTTAPSSTRATQIIKFADDTTVVGLISRGGGDESAYRDKRGGTAGGVVQVEQPASQHQNQGANYRLQEEQSGHITTNH